MNTQKSCFIINKQIDFNMCIVKGHFSIEKNNENVNEIEIEIYVCKNYCVVLSFRDIYVCIYTHMFIVYNHENTQIAV